MGTKKRLAPISRDIALMTVGGKNVTKFITKRLEYRSVWHDQRNPISRRKSVKRVQSRGWLSGGGVICRATRPASSIEAQLFFFFRASRLPAVLAGPRAKRLPLWRGSHFLHPHAKPRVAAIHSQHEWHAPPASTLSAPHVSPACRISVCVAASRIQPHPPGFRAVPLKRRLSAGATKVTVLAIRQPDYWSGINKLFLRHFHFAFHRASHHNSILPFFIFPFIDLAVPLF